MTQPKWPWGRFGDHTKGEIELDPTDAADDSHWAFRNQFVRLRDDPVRFPDRLGAHISIHPPHDSPIAGVVMLPLWDGDFILCRNYRHAPRRWCVEAPRGSLDAGERPLAAAQRELKEEYGVDGEMIELGSCNPDSGLLAADVTFFWCLLNSLPELVGEVAKQPPLRLSFDELLERLRQGEIQDGLLCVALTLAMSRGLIPLARP